MRFRLRTLLIVLAIGPALLTIWYWQAQAHLASTRSHQLNWQLFPMPDVQLEPIIFGMSAGTLLNVGLLVAALALVVATVARRSTKTNR